MNPLRAIKTISPWFAFLQLTLVFLLCAPSARSESSAACLDEAKAKIEKTLPLFAEKLAGMEALRPRAMGGMLKEYLEEHPEVFGAAFAFAPAEQQGRGNSRMAAPYAFRTPNGIQSRAIPSDETYDYTRTEWYAEPLKQNKGVWSKPYYDDGGAGFGVRMITYSLPVYQKTTKKLMGVATSDIELPVDEDIMTVLNQFSEAYAKRDLQAVKALLLEDAGTTIIGTGKDEKRSGIEDILAQVKRDWEQSDSYSMKWGECKVASEGSVAWAMGECLGSAVVKGEKEEFNMRFTAVFVRRGEKWLIAQTHFSMPLEGQKEGQSFLGK